MAATFPHISWLHEAAEKLKTVDGKEITVYELIVDESNQTALSEWARHFREHYCLDNKIDKLRSGTGKTRSQYLTDLVFPDAKDDFGPATRSGDFAEIVMADILETRLGYWVPRTRYSNKMVRNESPKGTDIIGFKFQVDVSKPSKSDILITFESKAQLSGKKAKERLQDAVKDSAKDAFRIAESLNAIKHRLYDMDEVDDALRVERFQDPLGNPYEEKTGASAFFCSNIYDAGHITSTTDCSNHTNFETLSLVVVHAKEFMKIVHALYDRAAHEA